LDVGNSVGACQRRFRGLVCLQNTVSYPMDPWNLKNSGQLSENDTNEEAGSIVNGFPDSFLDENVNKFEKLPDSDDYLRVLEKKLKAIEAKKGQKPSLQCKEEILGNLIRSESKQILGILSETDLQLDREIQPNLLLRQLAPKQPLTVGETVHLVSADQLDREHAEQNPMSD